MTLGYISLLSQNTTWSRLNISLKSFQNIVDAHNFSDNVYDVVQAFRRRRSEIHQFRWNACRARLTNPVVDHFGQSSTYHASDFSPNSCIWQRYVTESSTQYATIATREIHSLCARWAFVTRLVDRRARLGSYCSQAQKFQASWS